MKRKREQIQVFVKTLTGKTIIIECTENTTIVAFKKLIGKKEGIPFCQIRIIFAGKEFEDYKTPSIKHLNVPLNENVKLNSIENIERKIKYMHIDGQPCITIEKYEVEVKGKIHKFEEYETALWYVNLFQWVEPTLREYKVEHQTTTHMVLRLRGGMFDETSGRKDFENLNITAVLEDKTRKELKVIMEKDMTVGCLLKKLEEQLAK